MLTGPPPRQCRTSPGASRKQTERPAGQPQGQAPAQRPRKNFTALLTALGSSLSRDRSPCPSGCQLSGRILPFLVAGGYENRQSVCPLASCLGGLARGGHCLRQTCLGDFCFHRSLVLVPSDLVCTSIVLFLFYFLS